MYIQRDITQQLTESTAPVQILLGPRQCGKSTLLASLSELHSLPIQELTFDDLALRKQANNDPALFLAQFTPPLLLDEIQYVPNLFPEIKKQVDEAKRKAVFHSAQSTSQPTLFYLTGSNQILMDQNVYESLAGRASYFYLNTLSVHEILSTFPDTPIASVLFQGGWPELYTHPALSATAYLNDYIRSYVDKDIVMSAGVQKISEFHTVLALLSARTGQLLDYSNMAQHSGVSSVTVKEWTQLLEQANLIYLLKPFHSNLNKRLTKTPKIYFLDTGLAARLQGWSDATPLLNSPQAGHLFETLVLAEIIKFIQNYRKDWSLYLWRTKEGEEIDFILKTNQETFHAFEAKLAIHGLPQAIHYPSSFKNEYSPTTPLIVVTFGGRNLQLSADCQGMPIAQLHDYLQTL